MKKRLLAGLLVLCMVLALSLTACQTSGTTTTTPAAGDEATTTTAAAEGSDETTTAAEGGEETTTAAETEAPATWENLSWEKDTSPVTFSMYIDWDWWAWDDWGTDATTQKVTELTGVNLEVTKGSDRQVLSVQLAAQELSDFVFTDNLTQRFEDPEVCYRWDELIQEHCPEFWDLVDPLEKINNQAADGHVYTFRTHYGNDQNYTDPNSIGNYANFTVGYRADITEKLGIATPFTSVEGFEEALYKVKDNAADVGVSMVFNMHPDWSYPLAYWMGCQQGNVWDAESKSIKMLYNDADWLEYYKLLNKWYREGILTKDYLGVRPEDFFARDKSGEVFATSYNNGYAYTINAEWRKNGTGGKDDDLTQPVWEIINDVVTYKGEDRYSELISDNSIGWASCFISSNCENPGRAICFMEFMKSPEGDKLSQLGIEGLTYNMVDGVPKQTEEYINADADTQKTMHKTCYFQGSNWCEGLSWAAGAVNAKDEWAEREAEKSNARRLWNKNLAYANKNPAMSFARVESEDDEMAAYTKLADQWKVATAAMVTAESEAAVEQQWNDFQAYAQANGLEAVEAKMTSRYIENLKRYQEAGFFTDIVVE